MVIWHGIGMAIWVNFLLFPFYESYGKIDALTSLARAFIYLAGAFLMGVSGVLIRKLSKVSARKLLSLNMVVKDLIFYGTALTVMTVFPASDTFTVVPFLVATSKCHL